MNRRRLRFLRPVAAGLCAAALVAQAPVPSWSPEFAASGLGGRVLACRSHNGELYAGGTPFAARGGTIRGIARYDGTQWQSLSTGIELTAPAFPFSEPLVSAIAPFQGQLAIAGTFDRAGGQPCNHVALWNGTTFQPLGQGLALSFGDPDVTALAVFQNELYAAGQFDLAGGQPANGIARWDGTTWRPVGNGLWQSNSTVGYARALHVHNGALYVGGEFDTAGGVAAQNVASWNGTAWAPLGAGAPFAVRALTTFGTQLVAAAQFQLGGAQQMLAAWNGSTWSALGTGGPDLPVKALCVLGTDLYAGGVFYNLGPYLARFDGASWTSVGGVAGAFGGVSGPFVAALVAHNGELVIGGEFTTAGAPPARTGAVASAGIAAFDGVATWRPVGTGLGLDRQLRALLPWRGGFVAVGGFGEAGTVASVGAAFHDGDRWSPLATFDGAVSTAAVWQGSLVVSGSFTRIDGVFFPGIARFDGAQWHAFGPFAPPGLHAHGGDLFAYGGGGGLQRWNGSSFATVALPGAIVSHLHTHRDGLLYVTTDNAFTHAVHVWDGTSATQIGAPNDFVHALSSFGNEVVIGGRFTSVSGTAATLMARWNGTAWRAMPAPVSGYSADAFGELDGVLYAGVSGDPRGFCLRLQGNTWTPVGTGTDGLPQLFVPDRAVASIWVSGPFDNAGGAPSRNLGEWRTQPAWRNRLHGLPGSSGMPLLRGRGAMQGGTVATWTIETAPAQPGLLVFGLHRVDLPLLGATLVPSPDATLFAITDAQGEATSAVTIPATLGPGLRVFAQALVLDAAAPAGFAATNALECTTR